MPIQNIAICSRCETEERFDGDDLGGGWMTAWTAPGILAKDELGPNGKQVKEFHLCPDCKPEFSKALQPSKAEE